MQLRYCPLQLKIPQQKENLNDFLFKFFIHPECWYLKQVPWEGGEETVNFDEKFEEVPGFRL